MNRFFSNFTNKVDAKGRISIPASYRAVLARDGFEGLYVHPSLDQMALDCGGNALLEEIDGLLKGLHPYSERRDMFARSFCVRMRTMLPQGSVRCAVPGSHRRATFLRD